MIAQRPGRRASLVPKAEPGDYVTHDCKEKDKDRWFVGQTNVKVKRVFNIVFDILSEGWK